MKKILLLALLFTLLSPAFTFSQDKQFDNNKWTSLRAELKKRTDAILLFQLSLMRSKGLDKKVWAQLAKDALYLSNHVDSVQTINTTAIKTTTRLNSNLTKTLGQTIAQLLMNDQKALKESAEMTAKLEAIEKQLIIEKQAYNKACEDSNRPDLLFDEKTSSTRPVGLGY